MSPSSHPSSPTTCLASQQTLALAMASHPRLGASSPAASLPLDALHRIRDMVSAAHLSLSSTVRLVSIRVKTGEAVECIELCYSDGSHRIHGGVGGTWREPLYLQPCEYLTRISGVQVPGRAVRSVRFDTSHGRVIRYAGHLDASQDCGAPFELTAPSGHEVRAAERAAEACAFAPPLLNFFLVLLRRICALTALLRRCATPRRF